MITIQTVDSRIIDANGGLATGYLTIQPNDGFDFKDTNGKMRKVTTQKLRFNFQGGRLVNPDTFQIAPTVNAEQDRDNLFYTVEFFDNVGSFYQKESWVVDISPTSIEVTDVAKIITATLSNIVTFVRSDNVSVIAVAGKVPRGGANGFLDASWIPSAVVGGGFIIPSYFQPSQPADPPSNVIALWNNGRQAFIWTGLNWQVIA